MPHKEKNIRSLTKALSWRILATLATIILVYSFTKDVSAALSVGALEVVVKFILYYGHERAWNNIHWGKVKHHESEQQQN